MVCGVWCVVCVCGVCEWCVCVCVCVWGGGQRLLNVMTYIKFHLFCMSSIALSLALHISRTARAYVCSSCRSVSRAGE